MVRHSYRECTTNTLCNSTSFQEGSFLHTINDIYRPYISLTSIASLTLERQHGTFLPASENMRILISARDTRRRVIKSAIEQHG